MKRNILLLLVALLPILASAYDAEIDGIYYDIYENEAMVTYRDLYDNTYSGTIVIPESITYSGKTYCVTIIGHRAFYGCSSLTTITIPEGVTSIGSQAFYGCSSLDSITIPNSVSGIGSDAFSGTKWYNNQPDGLVYAGKVAYIYKGTMPEETEITLKEGTLGIAGYAFRNSKGLTSITIPNSVTSIGSEAFYNCSSLTSINIPNSVIFIGNHAFAGCSSLSSSIAIPNGVTSIDYGAFSQCTSLTSITIPNSVTSIGDYAFDGCTSLTSITIPNSVTSIGNYAFMDCKSLTSINIPENVTSIGDDAFHYCSNLTTVILESNAIVSSGTSMVSIFSTQVTNYILGERIQTIGERAFKNCTRLTSITIPNNVTSIGNLAFYGCSGLNLVIIPDSVTSIGDCAFEGCNRLVSVTIGNSVMNIGSAAFNDCSSLKTVILRSNSIVSASRTSSTSMKSIFGSKINEYVLSGDVNTIGDNAFYGCTGMTSITIPPTLARVKKGSFTGCTSLTKVIVPDIAAWCGIIYEGDNPDSDFPLGRARHLYSDENTEIKKIVIPEGVTRIETLAFRDAEFATSLTLPNSLTYIGPQAFRGMTYLKSLTIPNNVNTIGNSAFQGCGSLSSVTIPSSVTNFGTSVFSNCQNLTTVTLESNSIVSVSRSSNASMKSFFGDQVKKYILGGNVNTIGSNAFYGCSEMTTIIIPSSVTNIGNNAFYGCNNIKFYVSRGSYALFYVWKNYASDPYEAGTNAKLSRPTLSALSTTQTTITYGIANMYPEFEYEVEHESVGENAYLITGLRPSYTQNVPLRVYYEDNSYSTSANLTTSPINPTIIGKTITASSLLVQGTYAEGDANVVSSFVTIEGSETEGSEGTTHGLNPNTSYNCKYTVVVEDDSGNTYPYVGSFNIRTASLTMTTQQPKVINVGNVIVAAISNLDDEETNVGFEWRRTDWTSEFESNSGTAYLYEGKMEGYIRNLYTEKLWKYRPYYESDSGNRYYGEWVGIDPTNTSYFEPTVHTYAQINVTGNRAEVKGYAMRGTDNVTSQGFMYWPSSTSVSLRKRATSVPGGAMVVNASGYVMTATLEDLEYETTYKYVAFVTTSEGETFYGEMQTFTTSFDPDGIEEVKASEDAIEIARYDIQGKMIAKPQKGINIIRYSDGTTRKVLVK